MEELAQLATSFREKVMLFKNVALEIIRMKIILLLLRLLVKKIYNLGLLDATSRIRIL